MIFNSVLRYGWLAILLHWLSALLISGLFFSGLWMVGLDYYDSWYTKAPFWHKSVGVIFFILAIFRLSWRLMNVSPAMELGMSKTERRIARLVQFLLYGLMLCIPVSGYWVSTAKGNPVDVFGWFLVPVTFQLDNSTDIWSEIHEVMAWLIILLAVMHVTAALKHHFINKDKTLLKMLGLEKGDENA